MLQFFRKKSNQRKIFIGMCILIIPGFVMWGTALEQSDIPKQAGIVGSKRITTTEFIRNYEALSRELQLFHGVTRAQTSFLNLQDLTWQRILLTYEAERRGIKITNRDVVEWLQSLEIFQQDGAFSASFYKDVMNRFFKIDPRRFEEDVRDFLAIQRMREAFKPEEPIASEEVRHQFNLLYSPRDIEYVVFSKSSLMESVKVTDEEMQKYYDWLKDSLFHPDSVQVRYISVPKDSFSNDLSSTEIEELYSSSGYQTPFISQSDPIPGIGIAPSLTEAAFKIETIGQRSEWLEWDNKMYLFELVKSKEQSPMSFEDAQLILERELLAKKVEKETLSLARAFKESAENNDFDEAAQEFNVEVLEQAEVSESSYIEKVGDEESVTKALQKYDAGSITHAIQTSNGYMVAKINKLIEPDENLWESAKDQIKKSLLEKREALAFEKQMNELSEQLKINPKAMESLFPSKNPTQKN